MNSLPSSSPTSFVQGTGERAVINQDELRSQTLLHLRSNPLTLDSLRLAVKRSIDIAGTLTGLLLLAPVMLVVAALIRLDSPGPIFFRQLRRGHRGRLFWVIKFRTMVVDAEKRLGELEAKNESGGGVLFKMANDPRVTPLGRFLRRSSLDELPQLFNILRGEMSVVGPRPLQIRDSELLQSLDPEGYRQRLQVMPGLTGPWQVGGRSNVDYARMVEMDIEYAKNWSIGRDLWIIFRTFIVVIGGRGAC